MFQGSEQKLTRLIFIALGFCLGLAAAPPASATQDSLHALALNAGLLRFLNYSIVPMVHGRQKALPSALARESEEQKLDLLALEEVWEGGPAQSIRDALEPLGYTVVRPTSKIVYGTGLLFAIRAPWRLESATFVPFKDRTSAEIIVEKGFILARLRSPSGIPVLVAHAHMQAIQFDSQGNAVRDSELITHRRQAGQIEAALRQAASLAAPEGIEPSRIPRLLIGDLNAGPDAGAAAYTVLTERYGWAPPEDLLLRTWDPTNPLVSQSKVANKNPAMIDHCLIKKAGWVSGRMHLALTEPVPGLMLAGRPVPVSDHFGLRCELQLSELQPAP